MKKTTLDSLKDQDKVGALCLGNFDGVHLGHRCLIEKAVVESKALGLQSALATFSPHPREFFSDDSFQRIYPEKDNERLIDGLGIEKIFYIEFNHKSSSMQPSEFLNYLKNKVSFQHLVVGFDFKFGSQRSGGLAEIKNWCADQSIELSVLPKVDLDGEKVSSSRIRSCLREGDFFKAKSLLGHSYALRSLSFRDRGLGKTLGFPTLNLKVPKNLVLKNGVYSVQAVINNTSYKAIANLGFRPTVDKSSKRRVLEVHLIDKSIEDKVHEVTVIFKTFMREEMSFVNLESLKKQIELDLSLIKTFE